MAQNVQKGDNIRGQNDKSQSNDTMLPHSSRQQSTVGLQSKIHIHTEGNTNAKSFDEKNQLGTTRAFSPPQKSSKDGHSGEVLGTDKQPDLKTEDRNDKKNITGQALLDMTKSDSLKFAIETPESKVLLHNDKRVEVKESKPISKTEKLQNDKVFSKEKEMKNSINKKDFEGVKLKQSQLKQNDRSPKPPIPPSVPQVRK